jgi:hypothetical protein
MKINRLLFSIEIKATKNKIWTALWNDKSYRKWASVFFEGSYAISDNWKEGSRVLFLAPDQSGIYSIIERHNSAQIMHFKHIGKMLEGKEQAIDAETKKWSGTEEIYTLTEGTESNNLTIEIDVLEVHLDFMTEKLPKALEVIKQLSEN